MASGGHGSHGSSPASSAPVGAQQSYRSLRAGPVIPVSPRVRNFQIVTGPAEDELARAQQLADAMTVRSMRPLNMPLQGAQQAVLSPWEGVAQLGEALIARKLNKRASDMATAQKEAQQKANMGMVEQLTRNPMLNRMGDQQGAVVPPQDFETGQPMLSSRGEQLAAAMQGVDPKVGGSVLAGRLLDRALPQEQQQEGFTLSPGAVRYDAQGRQIAAAPTEKKGPGALYKVVDPTTGRVRYASAEEAVSMAPAPDPRPQGPTGSWSAPFQGVGPDGKPGLFTMHSISGQIRPAGVSPIPKDGTSVPGADMNDRQRSGLRMQQDAALSYAANITGLGRDEIQQIYATEGPDGIARVMNERGERNLQGWKARVAQSLPGGETLVDAMNSDLIAPAKAGGAGIALFQNPAGPITTPDFQAGQAQFPSAIYPLHVQAEMIRQMLKQGGTPAPTVVPQQPTESDPVLENALRTYGGPAR